MKLFLFSGTHTNPLNQKLLELSSKPKNRITYIPSSSKSLKTEQYYESWKETFKDLNNISFNFFAIDKDFSIEQKEAAFSSEIVYLSGGDTINFWNTIKEKGLEKDLIDQANKRVLCGLSAGSIIMTPNSRILEVLGESNDINIQEQEMLSLVDFGILPHYSIEEHKERVLKLQKTMTIPIIALPNESAVSINGNQISLIGPHSIFSPKSPIQLNQS